MMHIRPQRFHGSPAMDCSYMRAAEALLQMRIDHHICEESADPLMTSMLQSRPKTMNTWKLFALMLVFKALTMTTEALSFPAVDLQRCRSAEDCCTPVLDTGSPTKFKFQSHLPLRIRQPANRVDAAYAAKIQMGYELMRALPDTDGRSLKNQAKLHCAYCDNNFYFPGNEHPLEIHQSWLFLPWHRMFVYFHERILAHLLQDDTFALPFWYWDDTSPESDSGNRVPELYAEQSGYGANGSASFLYDADRNACAQRPNIVDLVDPFVGCTANKTNAVLRSDNAHLMYTHMVAGAVTPSLFFGQPYRFGDKGGVGGGTLEVKPHGPIHIWVNVAKMLTNKLSASDPIFFAHHANVDRLWTVWKTIPGGTRNDITDPDWLNTEFTYYNEDGKLVIASIAQSLDIDNLRYKYAKVATPWMTGAVDANESTITTRSWPLCNTASPGNLTTMFQTTPPFRSGLSLSTEPVSFKVRRKAKAAARWTGEEVLQVKGTMNWTLPMSFNAFVNYPEAVVGNGSLQGCREYIGSFLATPHEGSSPEIPGRLHWRVALRHKLRDLEAEAFGELVVTLVPPLAPNQTIAITSAKILHISS